MPKNLKEGDPLGFFNIHFVAKHQKTERGPFGTFKNFRKKGGGSLTVPKKVKRGPFCFGMLVEKLAEV